jgi:hypothetical protein
LEVDRLPMPSSTEGSPLRSRRLHIRLSATTRAELARRAEALGVPASSAARQLIEAQLDRTSAGDAVGADHGFVGMAGLVAAEHAVLMVASVLPEGQRRMHELAPQAALAAEERLALVRESGQ